MMVRPNLNLILLGLSHLHGVSIHFDSSAVRMVRGTGG